MKKDKEYFMKIALNQARISYKNLDVPVGAVVVYNNKVIAKSYNLKEKKNCAIYHAEIMAIEKACKKIKNFRLNECDIYITKEPCLMCLGAILSSRIRKVFFGAFDKKYSVNKLIENFEFNHMCEFEGGVLKEDCENLLSEFFKEIRNEKCKSKLKKKKS